MPRKKKGKKKEPPKAGKRLTPSEWAQIEEMWASGEVTLAELADIYGANASYLSTALAKRGIEKGSKADLYVEKAKEGMEEDLISDAAANVRRIKESKDEHYKYAQTIAKLIFARIAQCVRDKAPISDAKEDILTLKNAMSGLQLARADRWSITGLDREPDAGDEIPVLPIEEFTDEEIKRIQELGDPELQIPDSDKSIDELVQDIEQ